MALQTRRLLASALFALTIVDLVDGRSPALPDAGDLQAASRPGLSSISSAAPDAEYCFERTTLVAPMLPPGPALSPERPARSTHAGTARGFATPPFPPPRSTR